MACGKCQGIGYKGKKDHKDNSWYIHCNHDCGEPKSKKPPNPYFSHKMETL